MKQTMAGVITLSVLLAVLLGACVDQPDADRSGIPVDSPAPVATQILVVSRSDTAGASALAATPATPSAQATPARTVIRVWWPDELYPQTAGEAEDLLLDQFEAFRLTYTSYDLDLRRKRTSGMGGIMPSLRTAGPVAPGALPDLTLMRRTDMLVAATEGLIVPLDSWLPSDLVGDLLPGTQSLGTIDGALYGVPYALNLYHSIYRASMVEEPPVSFDDVLAQEQVYLFPAGTPPVSWTLLLQYLAAGGRLADADGSPVLDREPLVAVLSYYERGVEKGLFNSTLLQYTRFDDYWNRFASAEAHLIDVDSITYLAHKNAVPSVGLIPLPTLGGTPFTALDGWMWVVTTSDPDRQQQALVFLSWLMRISQQSSFTEAFGILPSQQRALRLWNDEAYAEFVRSLIELAESIPLVQRNDAASLALQTALVDVLGGASAETTADHALAALVGQG